MKDALLEAVVALNDKADLRSLPLDAREGFVLSRVDGRASVKTLAVLVGITEDETCGIVRKLLSVGAVKIKVAGSATVTATATKKPRPQEEVELPEADQQRIFELFEALPRMTHYEVLQIARDAAGDDLKAAYYRLSKSFHPDRFFGRRLGSYKAMLEALFRAGKLAYEILNDSAKRAAYDHTLPKVAAVEKQSRESEEDKRAALEAHRRRIVDERKAKQKNPFQEQIEKARIYAQESAALLRQGDVVAAAARLALALAYDPLNEDISRRHAELLPIATEARVKSLVEQAQREAAQGSFAAAARCYRDAHELVPGNAAFAARAAEYLYKQGTDGEEQRRLIDAAVAAAPKTGDYCLLRALILEKRGHKAVAREALERAMTLGCDPAEAKKLSKRFR